MGRSRNASRQVDMPRMEHMMLSIESTLYTLKILSTALGDIVKRDQRVSHTVELRCIKGT